MLPGWSFKLATDRFRFLGGYNNISPCTNSQLGLMFVFCVFTLVEFLIPKKEDPWALVRKLEAQLAQEKFYHEKTKTENQYEIKVTSESNVYWDVKFIYTLAQ